MNRLTKVLPIKFKVFIYKSLQDYKLNSYYKKLKKKNKFYIIGTPHHGNLGDQAIVEAEIKLLKTYFPKFEIHEIALNEYYNHFLFLKKHIVESDIILINGGGNFGNQYLLDENIRRHIITNFPQNKIVLFPQTIYFTNNKEGEKELQVSKSIYSNHPKLTLVAREKKSYELMQEHFRYNKILHTPDIVLYLNKARQEWNRSGALLCMRSDVESIFKENEKENILKVLKVKYEKVHITDTGTVEKVSPDNRTNILEEKLNEFRKVELVVTDRIHGMIFAAITATPCIALNNYNQKVKGTYDWIKHLPYVKFLDDINQIQCCLEELKRVKNIKYSNDFTIDKFEEIIKDIGLKTTSNKVDKK